MADPTRLAPPVGRLAPSPTGLLHLGHAHSFLLAWWHLRSRQGRVVLRFDDLDRERSQRRFVDETLRDLEWLGLDWDGAVGFQSSHVAAYSEALSRLTVEGHLFPCVCTRADLRRYQSAPQRGDTDPPYPGTCRDRFSTVGEAEAASGRAPALRFRVPPRVVHFDDGVFGEQVIDVRGDCGDFVVARRDGNAAYQLAVVCDDTLQNVTEVHRGADLLPSTARQWWLQRALALRHPRWVHFPLVVDGAGTRLAKRRDDASLAGLRAGGVDPRTIVAWVASSAGFEPEALHDATAYVRDFDVRRVTRSDVELPTEPWASRGRATAGPVRPERSADWPHGRIPASRRPLGSPRTKG